MKNDKFISESRLGSIIQESINNLLLTESQESKSISAAKRLIMQRFGYSEQQADKFVRMDLRQDLPTLRTPQGGKFILGVTRMFCDGELRDANTIGNLNTTLKYIASDAHINEYDRNLNGISAQDLIQRFAKNIEMDLENDRNEVGSMQFNGNSNYDIVRIDSFKQASEYGDYTSWCVTHDEEMYNSYTSNGINQFYFCLKKGFEDIPKKQGENCPLDEYGLSMIAVCVNENGGLNTCTCRWNHGNGGNDNILTTKEISEVIGIRFYDVFKPNTKWEDMVNDALQSLANGENPQDVFDWCGEFENGAAPVQLNTKCNFVNLNGELLSPNQWFDRCGEFENGVAEVSLNRKCNFMKLNGELLSPNQWFDWCKKFKEGLAAININDKWNFINLNGEIISDIWFDFEDNFKGDYAKVLLGNDMYCIDRNGNLIKEIPKMSESRIRDIIHESVMNYIKMDMIR